jgi:16S rRNA C967 or C1407 C5-methylase (RsmB/RsmF family)
MNLPSFLSDFIKSNDIDPTEYTIKIPRYIRITKPIDEIHNTFPPNTLSPTPLKDFYSLDACIKIKNNFLYNKGIYGMDLSSGIACFVLDIKEDDHILDLCCAPGSKTRYICDLLGPNGLGTITGVDFNETRLNLTKRLLQKHTFDRWRLFFCDGVEFDTRPPTRIGKHSLDYHEPKIQNVNSFLKPFHSTRLLLSDPQLNHPCNLYDKVIVDAECSNDGSISHLSNLYKQDFIQKLDSIKVLQRGLIKNGFRLLKKGGIMVYSTCSFSKRQNEDVVAWFLSIEPEACLLDIDIDIKTAPLKTKEKILEKCIRMSPMYSNTSGFFIAKIMKIM